MPPKPAQKVIQATEPGQKRTRNSSKAFDEFDTTIAKYGEENAYIVVQFFVCQNVVIVGAKDGNLSPDPAVAKSKNAYVYPLRMGTRLLAIDPKDNKSYSGQIMGIYPDATSAEDDKRRLDDLRKVVEASSKPKGKASKTKPAATELASQVHALRIDRSPRTNRDKLDEIVQHEPERSTASSITNPSTSSDESGAKKADISIGDEESLDDDNWFRTAATSDANHRSSLASTEEVRSRPAPSVTTSPEKVLLFPYELPKIGNTNRVPLVLSFTGAKVYIDEAVFKYFGKGENRPSKGKMVGELMDYLLGSEDGLRKLRRLFAEKRATLKSNAKSPVGMIGVLPADFLKCLSPYLDNFEYRPKSGDWLSRSMNRWKDKVLKGACTEPCNCALPNCGQ